MDQVRSHVETGIIGCGLIGASWAALFAASGRNVKAWDLSADARSSFASRSVKILDEIRALQLLPMMKPGQIVVCDTLTAVAERATFIQESVIEDLQAKRDVYSELEKSAASDAILASSSSAFHWQELFGALRYPGRAITAHPFNPPHLIPLVEIHGVSEETVSTACEFYCSMGRVPVCLKKPVTGHIANRLASALWREAVSLVAEGVADVEDIDQALLQGPGLRWATVGPFMAYHLGGGEGGIEHYLKHLGPSQERRWATLGNPKLTAEVRQQIVSGVEQEARGRSIGELEAERDQSLKAILKFRHLKGEP